MRTSRSTSLWMKFAAFMRVGESAGGRLEEGRDPRVRREHGRGVRRRARAARPSAGAAAAGESGSAARTSATKASDEHERRQVGLGEVAVAGLVLLVAEQVRLALVGVVPARLLAAPARRARPSRSAAGSRRRSPPATKRKELMFLSSVRVPSVLSPCLRTETFASQRKLPCSRLPSFTPRNIRTSRRRRRYSAASAPERRSGSPTISMSGVPARFRSTTDSSPRPWTFLPASSSMWTRRMAARRAAPVGSRSRARRSPRGAARTG